MVSGIVTGSRKGAYKSLHFSIIPAKSPESRILGIRYGILVIIPQLNQDICDPILGARRAILNLKARQNACDDGRQWSYVIRQTSNGI